MPDSKCEDAAIKLLACPRGLSDDSNQPGLLMALKCGILQILRSPTDMPQWSASLLKARDPKAKSRCVRKRRDIEL